MRKTGCTAPYFTDKNNICTKCTLRKEVHKLFNQTREIFKSCLHPCTYVRGQMITSHFEEYIKAEGTKVLSRLELHFEPAVKKTKDFYSYGSLSLFAEVGGYMGLLLGYSVYNFADFIEYLGQRGIKQI